MSTQFAIALTILGSILIIAMLIYNVVDRVLDHREFLAGGDLPHGIEAVTKGQQSPLDKAKGKQK